MVYTPDFTAIKEALTQTWTLGTEWLIPLALALLVMAVITRDTEKWKILSLPIFVIERIMGIPVHFIIMTISGILFAVEVLSTQVVGNVLGVVKNWSGGEDVIGRSRTEREFRRANRELRKAERNEMMNTDIERARLQGLIPQRRGTKISDVLIKSMKKRNYYQKTPQGYYENEEKTKIVSPLTLNRREKEIKKLKKKSEQSRADRSWLFYKRYGAKDKNTVRGEKLKTAIKEKSKKLKRRLSEDEIKKLYMKIGREEGRFE